MRSCSICLSLSDSFHLAYFPPSPSMLLQIEKCHSSLWLCTIVLSLCVCVPHDLFIHSSIDGHLDCIYILRIANNSTVNIGVHVSFQISVFVFFGYIPRNGIAGSPSSIYFSEKCSYYFPQWQHQFTFPPTVHKDSLFATSLVPFCICVLFDDSHSHRYEVAFHCDTDLHFPDGFVMLRTFSCAC